VPAREKLSPTEQSVAYLIGGGIALALAALILIGFGTIDDSDITTSLLLVGLALIVIGIVAWMITVRPWERFDDLKTPQYTGHAEHEAEAIPAQEHAAELRLDEAVPGGDETPEETVPAPVAAEAVPDNLEIIEGIGPKIAAALRAAGVTDFGQIAGMSAAELGAIVKQHGVRAVGRPDTWPMQATMILAGDLTEFADYKKRVRSGVLHDDLTQIEGIGTQAQWALYKVCIRSFKDLAGATPDQLRAALDGAGLKSHDPHSWPEQANLIVQDDLTGLKALQDRLRGGR
jgi:predicted flap endonuclease-1-like 5' DNA nuclease